MAWNCKFIQDTAEPGLGTMRAEFADESGAVLCVFEQQMKNGDDSQAGAFIEAAKGALAKRQEQLKQDADQQTLAQLLAAKLNG